VNPVPLLVAHGLLVLAPALALAAPGALLGDPRPWLLALLASGLAWAELPGLGAPSRPSPTAYRRSAQASGLGLLAIYWSGLLRLDPGAARAWCSVAGAVAMALGVCLRAWSIAVLGRSFLTPPGSPRQAWVRGGPYRFCAHPSEVGLLLVGLGAAVMLEDLVGLALWGAVLVPTSLWRARSEAAPSSCPPGVDTP
jgi:hypothetical protein